MSEDVALCESGPAVPRTVRVVVLTAAPVEAARTKACDWLGGTESCAGEIVTPDGTPSTEIATELLNPFTESTETPKEAPNPPC